MTMHGQRQCADGLHQRMAHVQFAVTVAFLTLAIRVVATGGGGRRRGYILAHSRQCRGDTGNHRICGYSRRIRRRVIQSMMMMMMVGMRMGVMVIQVRQRLLQLLKMSLGLTVVRLSRVREREREKEMSPGGAAGNCYEFVLVRFSFDFGKRISDSNLFWGCFSLSWVFKR